jgi:hypothetical protein
MTISFSILSRFGCALVAVVGFALYGCNKSVSIANPKASSKDFLDRISDKGKITCGAFVEKKFAGKTYEVAEANVSGKNGFGAEVQNVMGIVEDKSADLDYSLRLDDFNRFLAGGDTFGFFQGRRFYRQVSNANGKLFTTFFSLVSSK